MKTRWHWVEHILPLTC